jgi:hypothetical protein
LDYFNFNMDRHGLEGLTPDDDAYNLFTRLNTLEHGPNMDLNEFYALLAIFEGDQKTVIPPPTRTMVGSEEVERRSKGKRKWAEKLLRELQFEPKSEDGLPKKPHTKKKKKSGAAPLVLDEAVADPKNVDPPLEKGGVHVPDESKKKRKKKKKPSAEDAAPCVASKETVDAAPCFDDPKKKKKKGYLFKRLVQLLGLVHY